MRVTLGGTQPYSNGLIWNNSLGAGPETDLLTRFSMRMDLFVGPTEAGLPQALEFTLQQSFCLSDCGGPNAGFARFTYSMQCDFKDSGTWRVWNTPAFSWMDTAVPCSPFASDSFHTLTFSFSRPDTAHSRVDSLAIDGAVFPVDVTVGSILVAPSEEYLASLQLDGDFAQHPYSVLVKNWSIEGETAPEPASFWFAATGLVLLAGGAMQRGGRYPSGFRLFVCNREIGGNGPSGIQVELFEPSDDALQ